MNKKVVPITIGAVALAVVAVALKKWGGKRKVGEAESESFESERKNSNIGGITRIRKGKTAKSHSFDSEVISSWGEDIEQADADISIESADYDNTDSRVSELDSSDFGESFIYGSDESKALDDEGEGVAPVSYSSFPDDYEDDYEDDCDIDSWDSSDTDNLTAERLSKAIKQAKEVVDARKTAQEDYLSSHDSSEEVVDNTSESKDVFDDISALSDTAELELNKVFSAMTENNERTTSESNVDETSETEFATDNVEPDNLIMVTEDTVFTSDTSSDKSDLLSTAEFDKIVPDTIPTFED